VHVLTYLLAILAACANATSSVLQRKANLQVPGKQDLSPRLIRSLLHEPAWFGGVLAVFVGFLLQASALDNGQLSVVEPILVIELPATLLLALRVRYVDARREWATTVAMTAALAVMLYCLSPGGGRSGNVPWYAWLAGIGVNLAVVAAMTAWGRRGPAGRGRADGHSGAHQAAVLGVAAGATFRLTAALMKGMTSTFSHGIGTLLVSWQPVWFGRTLRFIEHGRGPDLCRVRGAGPRGPGNGVLRIRSAARPGRLGRLDWLDWLVPPPGNAPRVALVYPATHARLGLRWLGTLEMRPPVGENYDADEHRQRDNDHYGDDEAQPH